MKDLASIAAKYDTRKKSTCKVCDLPPNDLKCFRELRKAHRMSIRGLSAALAGHFGVSIAETTIQKHLARHEGA